MTDYTPAKDRLLVALANDMHLHANADYVVEAARAVLEEEKGECGCICPHDGKVWIAPDYYKGMLNTRAELAELKRRVARAVNLIHGWGESSLIKKVAQILEGKDK